MNTTSNGLMERVAIKKAVIYLRVSTEEQVENYSLDTQEDICRKEALRKGYQILEVFREEGKSAKNIIGRPVLIHLIQYCRKKINNIEAVFVYRLDRISRQTSDYLAIRKKLADSGVTILSSTEPTGNSPTEKLVETILAGFAQLDNDIRSERTRNGMRARFLSGQITSRPPLGYILQAGFAVKDPESFDLMKKAWQLMATGTKSLIEIAKIMTDWGLRTRVKNTQFKITFKATARLFHNKFYMGVLTSETYPEEVRGQHTPMISDETFYKVLSIIDGRTVNKLALSYKVRENPVFPLRRIAKCGKCGAALTGGFSRGDGGKYAYYRCSDFCTGKSIKVSNLEDEFTTLLKTITPTKQAKDMFIAFIHREYFKRLSRLQKLKTTADTEITRLYETRKQLVQKNLSGIYSDEIFKEQNKLVEDQILKAQIAKHDETYQKYDINKITDFIKTILADLGITYQKATLNQKKVFVSSIFPSGITWNYPGISNCTISPLYQSIQRFPAGGFGLGEARQNRTVI